MLMTQRLVKMQKTILEMDKAVIQVILLDTLCLVFILSNGKYIDLQIDKNGKCLLLSNFEDILENCN